MKGYRDELGRMSTPDPEAYFWDNVKKDEISGCWNWKGNLFAKGYGIFKNKKLTGGGGHQMSASRAAWMLFKDRNLGRWDFVCHRCDNPRCCNPDHLFLGSPKANMQDCVEKARINRGEDRPQSKLTEEDVRQIRRLRQSGVGWLKLGAQFGVNQTCIISVCDGTTWAHVDEPLPTYIGKPGRKPGFKSQNTNPVRGSANNKAKLTDGMVREMRALRAAEGLPLC